METAAMYTGRTPKASTLIPVTNIPMGPLA